MSQEVYNLFNKLNLIIHKLMNRSWYQRIKGVNPELLEEFYTTYRMASQWYEHNKRDRNKYFLDTLNRAAACYKRYPED